MTSTVTPTILQIPELLERILTFVPPRDRLKTRLVSRDWSRAATVYLDFRAEWVEHPVALKHYTEVLKSLAVITHFIYKLEEMYFEEMIEVDVPWRRLRDRILCTEQYSTSPRSSLDQRNSDPHNNNNNNNCSSSDNTTTGGTRARIRFFDCRGTIQVRSRLLPLFKTLPQLTRVRFRDCDLSKVTLNSLFAACPRLQVLEILSPSNRTLNLNLRGLFAALTIDDELHGRHLLGDKSTRLERLVLHKTWIHPSVLEDLVRNSPRLQELSLTDISRPEAAGQDFWSTVMEDGKGQGFIHLLADHCPSLHTFTFKSPYFLTNDMIEPFGRLEKIQTLGLSLGFMKSSFLTAIEPRIQLITHLDLLSFDPDQESRVMETLHAFLCQASNLVSFASTFEVFDERFLDLGHARKQIHLANVNDPSNTVPTDLAPFQSRNDIKVWACRNLQELTLRIRSTVPDHEIEDPSLTRQKSRSLFGYISQVCPSLRRLTIDRQRLDCSLDGGLCLLTGLQDLEHLQIQVIAFETVLNLWDFSWMAKEPTRLQRLADRMSSNSARFEATLRAKYEWLGIQDPSDRVGVASNNNNNVSIRGELRKVGLFAPMRNTRSLSNTSSRSTASSGNTTLAGDSGLELTSPTKERRFSFVGMEKYQYQDHRTVNEGPRKETRSVIVRPDQRWPKLKSFMIEQQLDRRHQQATINGFIKKFRPDVQVSESAQ
ncbi:hypothetical protein BGZ83_009958 [Gryganskiella cystojenkinii]|nr:hypothetical protein BGZ83_009958 [Gryganskiella cystojenkinii]